MEGIGPYIRRRRDELDISLREFAKKLNCSPAFISDIELGRRHPSEKVLIEIARELKVTVEELRAQDVRPPIEEIKRVTQDDPTFALAFRTVIDKNITADELLEFVKKRGRKNKGKRNEATFRSGPSSEQTYFSKVRLIKYVRGAAQLRPLPKFTQARTDRSFRGKRFKVPQT